MKILVYPKDSNPYQELLYTELRKQGDTVRYLSTLTGSATLDLFLFPLRISLWRLQGYTVFHLHWATAFSLPGRLWHIKPLNFLLYGNYLLCLKSIKLLGYKLVWTAHNVLPHEQAFPNDITARVRLVSTADLIIAHSENTIEELRKIGAEPTRFVVIAHGNYIGAYPNAITNEAARKRLLVAPNEFVYLYLGQIRPYKGVGDLIEAFSKLENGNKVLIIAGKCQDTNFLQNLKNVSLPSNLRILFHNEYISDVDLQVYFSAANVVALPFNKIATSGSVLLALSFGKAVIVPSLGDMIDLPNSISYKYPPTDVSGLTHVMEHVAANPDELKIKNQEAKLYLGKLGWSPIAKQTHEAMQGLLEDSKRGPS